MTKSKAMLAAGLSLGALMLAVPADAQRAPGANRGRDATAEGADANTPAQPQPQRQRGGNQAGGSVRVSDAFRVPAAAAQTALAANDAATAEPQIAAAEAAARSDDEQFIAAEMRYRVETLKRNAAGRAAALDRMIASPKLPAASAAQVHFVRGTVARDLRAHADAVRFFTRARELGSTESDLTLQLALAYFDSGNRPQGLAEIDRAIQAREASGQRAPEDWYKFVVSQLYTAGDRAGAATWLMRQIRAYPSPAAWRSVVLVYMEQAQAQSTQLSAADRIDLYRLMRATRALAGESDYFNYARAAQQTGLASEAKAVIDEGRAAGRIQRTSAIINQVYTAADAAQRADAPLATLDRQARAAANGRMAAQTADVYLGTGNYAQAIALYGVAQAKGGVDADTLNLHLGIAQALSGDRATARTSLARVTTGPKGEIARFWTAYTEANAAPAAAPAPATPSN